MNPYIFAHLCSLIREDLSIDHFRCSDGQEGGCDEGDGGYADAPDDIIFSDQEFANLMRTHIFTGSKAGIEVEVCS
jgi:hypothetical protein